MYKNTLPVALAALWMFAWMLGTVAFAEMDRQDRITEAAIALSR